MEHLNPKHPRYPPWTACAWIKVPNLTLIKFLDLLPARQHQEVNIDAASIAHYANHLTAAATKAETLHLQL
jgi:hypothetical protein